MTGKRAQLEKKEDFWLVVFP